MAAYEINQKKKINFENWTEKIIHSIKMRIYTLSFTNLRILNGCELPCFYDFQSPIRPVLFIDAVR